MLIGHRLISPLVCDFADRFNFSKGGKRQSYTPVQCLTKCKNLRDVTLVNLGLPGAEGFDVFDWRFPLFWNLRKLFLQGLEREPSIDDVDDIAQILLNSPGLTSLGRSLLPEEGCGNDLLRKLINQYKTRRTELGIPLCNWQN